MPLATARAIVEAWEVVIDSQAWRREMWRCPRVPRVLRIALDEEKKVSGAARICECRSWRYRSEGETTGKLVGTPSGVMREEGLPERRRKSSWSMRTWVRGCGCGDATFDADGKARDARARELRGR